MQDDINTLNNLLLVAKNYIVQYTGQTLEALDTLSDIIIVVFISGVSFILYNYL